MDQRILHKHRVLVQADIEEALQAPNSQQVNFRSKRGYMKKHVIYGHKKLTSYEFSDLQITGKFDRMITELHMVWYRPASIYDNIGRCPV